MKSRHYTDAELGAVQRVAARGGYAPAKAYALRKAAGLTRKDYRSASTEDAVGAEAIVAAVLRQAIDEASGVWVAGGATANDRASAVAFLRGRAWEPWVAAAGADPEIIRAALVKRLPFMQG